MPFLLSGTYDSDVACWDSGALLPLRSPGGGATESEPGPIAGPGRGAGTGTGCRARARTFIRPRRRLRAMGAAPLAAGRANFHPERAYTKTYLAIFDALPITGSLASAGGEATRFRGRRGDPTPEGAETPAERFKIFAIPAASEGTGSRGGTSAGGCGRHRVSCGPREVPS